MGVDLRFLLRSFRANDPYDPRDDVRDHREPWEWLDSADSMVVDEGGCHAEGSDPVDVRWWSTKLLDVEEGPLCARWNSVVSEARTMAVKGASLSGGEARQRSMGVGTAFWPAGV